MYIGDELQPADWQRGRETELLTGNRTLLPTLTILSCIAGVPPCHFKNVNNVFRQKVMFWFICGFFFYHNKKKSSKFSCLNICVHTAAQQTQLTRSHLLHSGPSWKVQDEKLSQQFVPGTATGRSGGYCPLLELVTGNILIWVWENFPSVSTVVSYQDHAPEAWCSLDEVNEGWTVGVLSAQVLCSPRSPKSARMKRLMSAVEEEVQQSLNVARGSKLFLIVSMLLLSKGKKQL